MNRKLSLSLTSPSRVAANANDRTATALRVTALWLLSAGAYVGLQPSREAVAAALVAAVAVPAPDAFGRVSEALTVWCQRAAGDAFDGTALAALMLSAVDAAALCSQAELDLVGAWLDGGGASTLGSSCTSADGRDEHAAGERYAGAEFAQPTGEPDIPF